MSQVQYFKGENQAEYKLMLLLEVHKALESVNDAINNLGPVPQGF